MTETARASGLSRQAVYRAIARGELRASVVCSRIRIHPDDFLAWMDGDSATAAPTAPRTTRRATGRGATRHKPAPDGLRSLLIKRSAAT